MHRQEHVVGLNGGQEVGAGTARGEQVTFQGYP